MDCRANCKTILCVEDYSRKKYMMPYIYTVKKENGIIRKERANEREPLSLSMEIIYNKKNLSAIISYKSYNHNPLKFYYKFFKE